MGYPTLMYRCPGAHFAHGGQTYTYASAGSPEEETILRANGWSSTLTEAVEKMKAADEDVQPSRNELEKIASGLSIKFDGRTTDAALLKKIKALTEG